MKKSKTTEEDLKKQIEALEEIIKEQGKTIKELLKIINKKK